MHALDLATKFSFSDGSMTVGRFQDCGPIAEHCKRLQSDNQTGSSEMKHAAKIPFVFIEKYCNDHNIEFSEFMQNKEHMRRVLADPALAHFRIWKGAI